MDKKQITKAQKITEELLELLGVNAKPVISVGEEIVDINLETEESGILIGYHGETLEALQLILSLCIARELGAFYRVSVEIGDYKKNRISYLSQVVEEAKQRVLTENQEVTLPNLKSWERRIVHTLLQDDKEVVSQSSGEGRDRTLSILPKS